MIEASPTAIVRAAPTTASRPEAQSRLTVEPGTDVGSPASSDDIRATLRLSSPDWLAAPKLDLADPGGVEAGVPVEQRPDHHRAEVVGADLRERAPEPADRCAHRVDDEDLTSLHDCLQMLDVRDANNTLLCRTSR